MKSRTKLLIVAVVVLGIAVVSFGAAYAITNGQPDGNNHPYVGLVLFYDADNVPLWRCSSSLISPTLLLMAGHCTDGAVRAQVWFDAGRFRAIERTPVDHATSVDPTRATPVRVATGERRTRIQTTTWAIHMVAVTDCQHFLIAT